MFCFERGRRPSAGVLNWLNFIKAWYSPMSFCSFPSFNFTDLLSIAAFSGEHGLFYEAWWKSSKQWHCRIITCPAGILFVWLFVLIVRKHFLKLVGSMILSLALAEARMLYYLIQDIFLTYCLWTFPWPLCLPLSFDLISWSPRRTRAREVSYPSPETKEQNKSKQKTKSTLTFLRGQRR